MKKQKWFVRGDADGFVGLFVDNLLQLLLVAVLCPLVCGLPEELILTRILPAAAVSVVFGNFFYAWQGRRLAARTGRDDVTALPYGINTVSLIAFVFLVMGPVWRETGNATTAWQAGVFACLVSGIIELAAAFFVDPVRRHLPRAALLSTLAGIAVTFIAMGFAFQIFASPLVALVPMLLIVLAYAGRFKLPLGLPAGLVAILFGVGVAWILRWCGWFSFSSGGGAFLPGPHWPLPDAGGFWAFLTEGKGWQYMNVIFPMALFNVVGSLQSLESAEAAGDRYETRPSLAANGVGGILAGLFGSPFPTTIYIGHPGWKAMGARTGYSALNGAVIFALSVAGAVPLVLRVVPIEAALGILIWIGVVMMSQAYQETPKEHAVAVSVGLVPSLGAWAFLLVETTLRVAGKTVGEALPGFGNDLYINGVIALNQGFLLSSMLLSAMVAFAVDRRLVAAGWCAMVSAGLSFVGLLHAWDLQAGNVVGKYGWNAAPQFAVAYFVMGCALFGLGFWRGRRAA